jgi:hypothetical protein
VSRGLLFQLFGVSSEPPLAFVCLTRLAAGSRGAVYAHVPNDVHLACAEGHKLSHQRWAGREWAG